ncbi:methylmalonyl Co-A mutase-associated GTPase MeaB [Georgfuchsia toluolica]|nr:methylmalonyl Co-A mutase-associated GTPase MeaB [Georgfuchsia toluolica]
MAGREAEIEERVAGILAGRRRELGRAISEVENETVAGQALLHGVRPYVGRAHVVGITGPGGAGKSTLINALIRELTTRGQTLGVIAFDPSSPLSGGALLGDRIRMADHDASEKVFIRSLASRGHSGGLSRTAGAVIDILDAAGTNTIIVETLGAGQAEVGICDLADTKVVVCPPGLGDDVQAMKAGILEMADVLVVSKSDLPAAKSTACILETMLSMRPPGVWKVPLVSTIGTVAEGIGILADAVAAHARHVGNGCRHRDSAAQARRTLADLAAGELRRHLMTADSDALDKLCQEFRSGRIDGAAAAAMALHVVAGICAASTQLSTDKSVAANN